MPEMEHVPTAPELALAGLAEPVNVKGQGIRYRISDEGHALMGRILRANGRAAAEQRTRP